VANGLVYAASWDGTLYALDARTGALRWRHASIESTPTIADGVVYVSGDDHMFYAFGLPAAVRQS
jgi:outer membrane protein assembly factor BamB